jgi:Tol biopolymer transport system component
MRKTMRPVVAVLGAAALLGTGCTWVVRASHTDPAAGNVAGTVDRPAVSADGRYVAYAAHTDTAAPGVTDAVYRWDTVTDVRTVVSVSSAGVAGDDASGEPAISGDGRYVAFSSDAENLVAGDDNFATDVFVRDTVAGTTERISVTASGVQVDEASYSPSISADGRYIAFIADSDDFSPQDDNLSADAYVVTRSPRTVTLASVAGGIVADWGVSEAVLSADGRHLAFTTDMDFTVNDQNGSDDVYVRHLGSRSTTRISRAKNGDPEGGGGFSPSLSADGRFVAFVGGPDIDNAADPYPGPDVFVRDTTAGITTRLSTGPGGAFLNGASFDPVINALGTRVAFVSTGNVTGTDTNGSLMDVFVRDLPTAKVTLVSTDWLLNQTNRDSGSPAISTDGRYTVLASTGRYATEDTNNAPDVYIRAVDIPTVTSIAPTQAARGTSVTLTITGTNFLAAATVVPQPGVYVPTSVQYLSPTSLKATIAVDAAAATGPQNVYVKNTGTGPGPDAGGVGRCENCLTIR